MALTSVGTGARARLGSSYRSSGATRYRKRKRPGLSRKPASTGGKLTQAQRNQRSVAGKASAAKRRRSSPRPVGNRSYRRFAASRGSRLDKLAAGALSKSRAQRSAAERRAIRATAGTRGILKGRKQRTRREQRGVVRARRQYVSSINRMGDRRRITAGRAGRIARPRGTFVSEDYSIGKKRPGMRGNYSKAGGVRKPRKFTAADASRVAARLRRQRRRPVGRRRKVRR